MLISAPFQHVFCWKVKLLMTSKMSRPLANSITNLLSCLHSHAFYVNQPLNSCYFSHVLATGIADGSCMVQARNVWQRREHGKSLMNAMELVMMMHYLSASACCRKGIMPGSRSIEAAPLPHDLRDALVKRPLPCDTIGWLLVILKGGLCKSQTNNNHH